MYTPVLATVVSPVCQYLISPVREVMMAIQQELEVVFVGSATAPANRLHCDSCPHVSTMLMCDVWSVAADHGKFLDDREDDREDVVDRRRSKNC